MATDGESKVEPVRQKGRNPDFYNRRNFLKGGVCWGEADQGHHFLTDPKRYNTNLRMVSGWLAGKEIATMPTSQLFFCIAAEPAGVESSWEGIN